MENPGRYRKVVIVGPAYPLRGGLATYDERLAKAYKDQGCEVTLLTFSLQYPGFLFPGQTQYSTDPAPEGLDIDVAINSVNPLNWVKVGRKYKKLRPDLVIFRYWMPFMAPCLGTIARIIKSNNHTRIVAITDNVIPHERKFYDTPFTGYFLESCHGFVTMSQSVLDDLKTFVSGRPMEYTPHPMYDSFGPALGKADAKKMLGLQDDVNYLLFFGFIRKYKGLDLLLEAFADPRLRKLPLKLIIAGEFYEDKAPYMETLERLNLTPHVVLRNDFIPNSEVNRYFSASDLVVQTYKTATQSGVTQVAYFYNKPMLVTNVGGLAELVPHQKVGYVVEKNPSDIASAILDFYVNGREAAFVSNIRSEKKRFTWEKLMDAIGHVGRKQ